MPEFREEKIFDENDYKYFSKVFDFFTLDAIRTFEIRRVIKRALGIIKEGKESVIVLCEGPEEDYRILKIYKIETSDFKRMEEYIIGDPRFKSVRKKKRDLVYQWCRKEFSNLKKAQKAGVSAPEPYAFMRNILIMECVMDGDDIARSLDEMEKDELDDPEEFFWKIVEELRKLYKNAKLIHADVSEFNILKSDNRPVLIDFAQSVLETHPMADMFLERDVNNLIRFFKRGYRLNFSCNDVLQYIKN